MTHGMTQQVTHHAADVEPKAVPPAPTPRQRPKPLDRHVEPPKPWPRSERPKPPPKSSLPR